MTRETSRQIKKEKKKVFEGPHYPTLVPIRATIFVCSRFPEGQLDNISNRNAQRNNNGNNREKKKMLETKKRHGARRGTLPSRGIKQRLNAADLLPVV